MKDGVRTEEHRVSGEQLLSRIRELVGEGNARRIIIKNDKGHTLLEIPATVGVVGAVLMPDWVAVGAIAALAADYALVVERTGRRARQRANLTGGRPRARGSGAARLATCAGGDGDG